MRRRSGFTAKASGADFGDVHVHPSNSIGHVKGFYAGDQGWGISVSAYGYLQLKKVP